MASHTGDFIWVLLSHLNQQVHPVSQWVIFASMVVSVDNESNHIKSAAGMESL